MVVHKFRNLSKLRLCLVFVFFLFMAIAPQHLMAERGDDYPYRNTPENQIDRWRMFTKQCTSFVAWRLEQDGFNLNDHGLQGINLNHAYLWGRNAANRGYRVDKTPVPGSIAYSDRAKPSDSGHVAYVEAVDGDRIFIEEYNAYPKYYAYQGRWTSKNSFTGFIHFPTNRINNGGSNPTPNYNTNTPLDLGGEFYAKLKNEYTGRYITETLNPTDGGYNIASAEDNGGDEQVWKFIRKSGGWYEIENRKSGRLLDVNRANAVQGENVHAYMRHNAGQDENKAQLWGVFRGQANAYLQSKLSSAVTLDEHYVDNNLFMYGHHGGPAQTFSIEIWTPPAWNASEQVDLGSEFYARLKNESTGRYVTGTEEAIGSGYNVVTADDNGGDEQVWKFIKKRGGWYEIENKASGRLLDVTYANATSGENIQTYMRHNAGKDENKAQLWGVFRGRENAYLQSKMSSSLSLDEHQSTHNIYLYTHHGKGPQTFSIEMWNENSRIINKEKEVATEEPTPSESEEGKTEETVPDSVTESEAIPNYNDEDDGGREQNDLDSRYESYLFDLYDVEGHWARKAIGYVIGKNYFKGVNENEFAPNKTISRAEFITVLGRMAKIDVDKFSYKIFSDTHEKAYYTPYINWALEAGIVKGFKNKFSPSKSITREEMATMLERYLKYKGKIYKPKKKVKFVDEALISPWSKSAVEYISSRGIISGREGSTFAPKEFLTRAETAQVIYNMDKN